MNAQPRVRRVFIRTLLAAAVAVAGLWYTAQVKIDRCIDQGGRWIAETLRCERSP
jgi:predicted secreted protein